ncbi:acyl-CoA dehydrogenase family protein [Ramlibacter sp.]|uniref:acyl-CoA dehydrogenase family protein n=1 Tax=Ramlibacter sp. TaxID=1917967 RepID=UPI003D11FE6E
MDFSLSAQQRELQDSLEKSLAAISPISRVRRHADERGVFADDVWQGLADLGVCGLLVGEEFGGLGLGLLDAALVAEMLGRHVVPAPFAGAIVAAPLAVAAAGSDAQRHDLLPRIAAGTLRIGVALSEPLAGARANAGVRCRDGRLEGRALFAIDCADAGTLLVADDSNGLHLVDRAAAGLVVTPLDTVDTTRSTARLEFDGVPSAPLPGATAATLQRLGDALRVTLAADLLGASWKMIEQAVDYAKVREQFGRPIGSFQSVKHLCADMVAEIEPARALVWYAAHALDEIRPDASLAATHAKAYLSEGARFVARAATEVHGGIGITDALGLHYWFKRIAWDYQAFGAPERLREHAAALQGLA